MPLKGSPSKMEKFSEPNCNGNLSDPSLKVKRQSSLPSSARFSLSWFDIRVFYVRISNFMVDDLTPDYLTLNHIPSSLDTVLEVNGVGCPIDSEGMSCILRRDRVDKKSEEATFVSTDSIRLTGSVKFEVYDKEDLVISGVLELSGNNCSIGEQNKMARKWTMNCEAVNKAGVGFLKGKQIRGSESFSPTVEVYVAGCFSGTPLVLTKTLQINHQRKLRKGVLNSIPEYDSSESREDAASEHNLQVAEYKSYKTESEDECDSLYWRQTEYMYGEDGELSWFNAGVRVGVGIGLGICVGIGVGVGLLVRTYQTTTRSFKKRLF